MIYELGKRYLVPHAFGRYFQRDAWWPVIGHMHEDAEFIGFPRLHFHVEEMDALESEILDR